MEIRQDNHYHSSAINWYPGHMTKTRRAIEADLKQVDAVCELLDARIPLSSRNPDIDAICAAKPRLIVLNRMDLADPAQTREWERYFRARGFAALSTDCKSGKGVRDFAPAVRGLLQEKRAREQQRGMNRPIRIMIVGIPNVGKSTLINRISGRKGAKAANRPGVTRGKQWVSVEGGLLLLDTPGILWPKFEDATVGLHLAYTGAVKEDVLDIPTLAAQLAALLWGEYPQSLRARYGIDAPPDADGCALLSLAAKKRGMLLPGGEIDCERMAKTLLDEFRSGKLGRFTLEKAGEANA